MRAAILLRPTVVSCQIGFYSQQSLLAQAVRSVRSDDARSDLSDALTPAEWKRVDTALERALEWLASQQQPDGSFPTVPRGQPAITSLSAMAFLSCGHQPGAGQYGERLNRAIDFVLEGLYAQKKISRSEERGYAAAESAPRRPTRREEQMLEDDVRIPGSKKKYYN